MLAIVVGDRYWERACSVMEGSCPSTRTTQSETLSGVPRISDSVVSACVDF